MKMQWMAVVFLIAAVSATKPALAQCEHAGTTAATTDCFDREYKQADAELNRIYKLAFTGLDAKAADNLRNGHGLSTATLNAMPNTQSGAVAAAVRRRTWLVCCG